MTLQPIYLTLLVTMIGCGNDTPAGKANCVSTCDHSLRECVVTLGQENKMACHKTYDLVCMPSCSVKR